MLRSGVYVTDNPRGKVGSVVIGKKEGAFGDVQLVCEKGEQLAWGFNPSRDGRKPAKQIGNRVFGIEGIVRVVYERCFAQELVKRFFFSVPSVRTRIARRNSPA